VILNVGAASQPRRLISRLESRSHKEFVRWNLDFADKQFFCLTEKIIGNLDAAYAEGMLKHEILKDSGRF
jgi:hypothetical protein